MSVTVQQLIEAGYARSSANEAGKLAEDAELIALADRIVQALFAIAAALNPDAYQSRATIALAAGVGPLPTDLIDLRRVQTTGGSKVHVVPVNELDRSWAVPPVVFREGPNLVSRGLPKDPGPSDSLTIWGLIPPATLTVLTSAIDPRIPVRHHQLVINELALYLAVKDASRSPADRASIKAERDATWETFLRLSGLTLTALESAQAGPIIQLVEQLIARAPKAA